MPKTAIITGATSGIGISLIETCLKHDCRVIALSRKNSPNIRRLEPFRNIQVIEGDLQDLLNAAPARDMAGDDSVFYHFAWSDTGKAGRNVPELQQKNISYTMDAIQIAKQLGCKKFVGAGSQAEYGVHTDPKTKPDSPTCPNTAYGICKYAAGKLGAIWADRLDMDFFWVRIFSVYGKYDLQGTLIQSSMEKMLHKERCSFTKGTHPWDYLYCADAGKAFYLIGEKAKGNRVYCLGSGQARPLRDYICEMRDIICPNTELFFGEIPYNDANRMGMCADISALQNDTGWSPETDFKTGIRQIMKSFCSDRMKNEAGNI